MNTKKTLISFLLIAGFLVGPVQAQAWFWDKIAVKPADQAFSESDVFLTASRPLQTPRTYKPVKGFFLVEATGYSSTPDQTDHTPFITASGIHVREGVVAANFLPLGTIIRIPELFGDKVFVVEDRMHSRYWFKLDIWFPERKLAKEFGRKVVKIEIVS